MANSFKDLMLHDVQHVFLNTNEFAEVIEYYPKVGRPRMINALVDRKPPEQIVEVQRGIAPLLTISVANHATNGISAAELDTGGDRVKLALRCGGKPELRTISKLVDHDSAMLTIEVR